MSFLSIIYFMKCNMICYNRSIDKLGQYHSILCSLHIAALVASILIHSSECTGSLLSSFMLQTSLQIIGMIPLHPCCPNPGVIASSCASAVSERRRIEVQPFDSEFESVISRIASSNIHVKLASFTVLQVNFRNHQSILLGRFR